MLWSVTTNDQAAPWWQCSFCKAHEQRTKETLRVAVHITKCQLAPETLRARLLVYLDEKQKKKTLQSDRPINYLALDNRWIDFITEKGLPLDLGECE